jgi:hypothetical protein
MKLNRSLLAVIMAAIPGLLASSTSADVVKHWNFNADIAKQADPALTSQPAVHDWQIVSVPEPAALVLRAAGFGLFALLVLRRRKP